MKQYTSNLIITSALMVIFIVANFIYIDKGLSSQSKELDSELKYRTNFGNCPSRSAGNLSIILVKEFENRYSLADVKKRIVADNLNEKYFLSRYQIDYDPIKKFLKNFSLKNRS